MILDPDDDDDSYLTPPAQGKKPKVGTGYAGDQKEDVSSRCYPPLPRSDAKTDYWTSRSPGDPARQG
jgi:hypothetical protein